MHDHIDLLENSRVVLCEVLVEVLVFGCSPSLGGRRSSSLSLPGDSDREPDPEQDVVSHIVSANVLAASSCLEEHVVTIQPSIPTSILANCSMREDVPVLRPVIKIRLSDALFTIDAARPFPWNSHLPSRPSKLDDRAPGTS